MTEEKELTYGDLFRMFCDRNPDAAKAINDFRPAGPYTIRIWVGKSGETVSFTATWVPYLERFEIAL